MSLKTALFDTIRAISGRFPAKITGHAQNLADENVWDAIQDDLRARLLDWARPDDMRQKGELNPILWRLHDEIRRQGRPLAPWWREARCWLRLVRPITVTKGGRTWDDEQQIGPGLNLSWNIGGATFCHAYISLGGGDSDRDVSASLALPGVALWATLAGVLPRSWEGERELGVHIHNGGIWLKLWNDDREWHSKGDWRSLDDWRNPHSRLRAPSIYPLDLLLGRAEHRAITLHRETRPLEIAPGEVYMVDVDLTMDEWWRARWPVPSLRMRRANTKPAIPIPVPGKGENSWDCGDDAIYEQTAPAATVEEALENLRASVLRTRERYGGHDWRPAL